ncbi:hypothetical protein LOTGIDRAFT_183370 [Lottia gigantea]|uniref:U3 small nucleolar RNA-associated protein 11 n=1 Tax=Lottia gigantea TaxID=225164 RepID=V3ZDX2_LOTGI|nr:hypothetical protein LOTGIDRAFT_183370 [Lottia gigantea]ESO89318.1 hypothetical protein LOTGIDRAFT_183370 [Lottia gigantea]
MSSWKKVSKAKSKQHRERSQLESRKWLGPLEKKKDYKKRAQEQHRKDATIKYLRRKAENRNPDEYYFNMVKTRKVDGQHQAKESEEPEFTDTQVKIMESQDINYVNLMRSKELKKIEKLKSSLHVIDSSQEPQNKHIIFVDSKKEAKNFDAAQHFDTHPSLMKRVYNRPTSKMLAQQDLAKNIDDRSLNKMSAQREQQYKELSKRIGREKELRIISEKMEISRHLLDKSSKRKKISDGTKDQAPQYRWCFHRKR